MRVNARSTPLHRAVFEKNIVALTAFATKENINDLDRHEHSPLMLAIKLYQKD